MPSSSSSAGGGGGGPAASGRRGTRFVEPGGGDTPTRPTTLLRRLAPRALRLTTGGGCGDEDRAGISAWRSLELLANVEHQGCGVALELLTAALLRAQLRKAPSDV